MRVFVDGPRPGTVNMARDLELLAEGLPTLRLYQWRPACVSLGYPQPETDVDLEYARANEIDVVRRPTGGGAILHAQDEITYSVVLPRALAPSDLFASYRFIAQGVRNALRWMGLDSEFLEGHTGRDALCYLREEGVSVGVGGRKISGGAQKRTKTHILQHGTLLVSSDVEHNARLFRVAPEKVQQHLTSLRDQGLDPPSSAVRTALLQGFVTALRPTIEAEPVAAKA